MNKTTQHTPTPAVTTSGARAFAGGYVEANGVRYGRIVAYPQGYRFIPFTDAHKPSRKYHTTPAASVPKWVRAALAKVQP